MKKIILVKLGGSLISDKTKVNKARVKEIINVAKQIKKLTKDYSLIVFTGAGGYGHPIAEEFKNKLYEGIKEIKSACKEINKIVVDALINQSGLSAVSVEPDKVAEYRNGKMVSLSLTYIVSLLEKNVIPVFHADLVHDKKLGVTVLSMDKFLTDTAINLQNNGLKIEKAVFVGVVEGVVDRNGMLISKITRKNFSKFKDVFFKGKGVDVSGGMRYKVEQCLRLADNKITNSITYSLANQGTMIT
jgi:isopentenyl phosphate kinase